MDFHKKFATTAYLANMYEGGEVLLATYDTSGHLNLHMPRAKSCLHPDDAKRLRDLLIEAYPLPPQEAPKSPYQVYDNEAFHTGARFDIYREEMVPQRKYVAKAYTREAAEQIAAALNAGTA